MLFWYQLFQINLLPSLIQAVVYPSAILLIRIVIRSPNILQYAGEYFSNCLVLNIYSFPLCLSLPFHTVPGHLTGQNRS